MGNPTLAEVRNPTDEGRTPQESVDHMQQVDGGVKGPTLQPTAKPPTNIHPSARGQYGAPVGDVILHNK